jgi:hypothetical protein
MIKEGSSTMVNELSLTILSLLNPMGHVRSLRRGPYGKVEYPCCVQNLALPRGT